MSTVTADRAAPAATSRLYGVLAQFDDPGALLVAAESVRDAGFKKWDCFTPFPVHGLDAAMGLRPTILPRIVLAGGLTGCASGLLLQWFTNAHDYRYLVSGKPFFSLPAFIPVTFELTILFASISAFVGMIVLNDLPKLYHPLFRHARFRRATSDRFFVAVQAEDPRFDLDRVEKLFLDLGCTHLERVED